MSGSLNRFPGLCEECGGAHTCSLIIPYSPSISHLYHSHHDTTALAAPAAEPKGSSNSRAAANNQLSALRLFRPAPTPPTRSALYLIPYRAYGA